MTAEEFIKYLNDTYGIATAWPQLLTVDAETYANCCQLVFDWRAQVLECHFEDRPFPLYATVPLGVHNGLMFKGVELIKK